MTRPSKRKVEREIADLQESDDVPEFDDVGVVTETEDGYVDLETGEIVEDPIIVADVTGDNSEAGDLQTGESET